MRRVQKIMGTMASIDIPTAQKSADFDPAFDHLNALEEQFSPFKPTSELSKYRCGELSDDQLSAQMLQVRNACDEFQQATHGYFSAYFDGKFNPTGYVKGWAIREAGTVLSRSGYNTFLINIGGDILAAANGDKTWNVAIQHPRQRDSIIGTISISNGAIASSGTYERGQHIINPVTGQSTDLISATVVGPDIATADALATTCVAMGSTQALQFIQQYPDYDVMLIKSDESVKMTNSFAQRLNR